MPAPSLLSHDTKAINMKGFYNLMFLLLLTTNARLLLQQLFSAGSTLLWGEFARSLWRLGPLFKCLLYMQAPLLGAWAIERHIASHAVGLGKAALLGLQAYNIAFFLSLPYVASKLHPSNPICLACLLMTSIVWAGKLISFHHVCLDARHAVHRGDSVFGLCRNTKEAGKAYQYPRCVTLARYYTFLAMPTMCYQFAYPKSTHRRWLWTLRHLVESLLCLALIKVVYDQYLSVIAISTFPMEKLRSMSRTSLAGHFLINILKLSIPNLYVWLLCFVGLFHHWCNILAEMTLFADRCFYKDWWNASSFEEYWRKWNLPVNYFLNRHMNKPMRRYGVPRTVCSLVIFLVSALGHEYIVVTSLGLGWTGWIFWSFVAQVPLMQITNLAAFRSRPVLGNCIFWGVFVLSSHPCAILLYYYLYITKDSG